MTLPGGSHRKRRQKADYSAKHPHKQRVKRQTSADLKPPKQRRVNERAAVRGMR